MGPAGCTCCAGTRDPEWTAEAGVMREVGEALTQTRDPAVSGDSLLSQQGQQGDPQTSVFNLF